jgi:hypothetical protein
VGVHRTRGNERVVNNELMLRTLHAIEEHPEEWDQRYWRLTSDCGTTMCFAGWACTLAGEEWWPIENALSVHIDHGVATGLAHRYNVNVPFVAQSYLGIDDLQAHRLFYTETDDLQEMRNIVKEILEEAE